MQILADVRHRRSGSRPALLLVAGLVAIGSLVSPTSRPSPASAATDGRVVQVVAAENFWGSIASPDRGKHAHVVSIITNPNYRPAQLRADRRLTRGRSPTAQFVIENGIGYDPWVPKLLAADQGHPTVLDVGDLLGVRRRRQPPPLVQPDERADASSTRWSRTFRGSTPPTARTSTAQRASLQHGRAEAVRRDDRCHQSQSTRGPRSAPPSRSSPCSPRRSGSTSSRRTRS